MARTPLIAPVLLALLASASFAQEHQILSGSFEANGESLTSFVTSGGQRLAVPAGSLGDVPGAIRRLLPAYRAQVLFQKRGDDLVPVRLHAPRPFEGFVRVVSAGAVKVNGFDVQARGPLWQRVWSDDLRGREVRVVGVVGPDRQTGAEVLSIYKVEATVKAATSSARRAGSSGAPLVLTFGRRVWIQDGPHAADPRGGALLPASEEGTRSDAVSSLPWMIKASDLRFGRGDAAEPVAESSGTVSGLLRWIPR